MSEAAGDISDDDAKREALYRRMSEEADKRLLQNADNFDKAILTHSSAGLGVSIVFLKDFIPITDSSQPWLLWTSWALFIVAIVCTIGSYLTSQQAQMAFIRQAEQYYVQRDEDAFEGRSRWATVTLWAAPVAGLAFTLAVTGTACFVYFNLETSEMMKRNSVTDARNGATVPTMQRVSPASPSVSQETRGAPTPTLQAIPVARPVQSASSPASPAPVQQSATSAAKSK